MTMMMIGPLEHLCPNPVSPNCTLMQEYTSQYSFLPYFSNEKPFFLRERKTFHFMRKASDKATVTIKMWQLTWRGHVIMRLPTAPIRRCLDMHINVTRANLWKLRIKAAREDLLVLELIDGRWENCIAWVAKIHVAVDPNNIGKELVMIGLFEHPRPNPVRSNCTVTKFYLGTNKMKIPFILGYISI